MFTVHIDTDYLPREDVKGGVWQNMTSENISQFSAVAYHFGSYLESALDVPIGLISSNLGATTCETWMSNEALLQFPQFESDIRPIVDQDKNFAQTRAAFEKEKPGWEKEFYLKGPGIKERWQSPETDDSVWHDYTGPGAWEEKGFTGHDGAMWFRTSFDMPTDYEADSFTISLGQIDDYDITWVNGIKIGETYGRHNHRNYKFATSITTPKNNVLVVRAFDIGDKGGFTTSAFWSSKWVKGSWKMKKGWPIDPKQFKQPFTVNVTPFSSPAVLFNANIAPLTKLNISGIIWYQGESNTSRAEEYQSLFPALIKDWRRAWQRPDLPFIYVQLANYQAEAMKPGPSEWAELREAQDSALDLGKVGRAVAIDIGEANDIHPKNKLDVGKRLGRAALKIAYQRDIVFSGPQFSSMTVDSNTAKITWDHVGSGLLSKDKYGYVRGFALAGADQIFHWAKARIVDNQVWVYSEAVPTPVAARYAWSNNPGNLDLYNGADLPAAPFRTDSWTLSTAGRKYDALKSRF